MPVTLIVGGARSGKSSYAEKLCKNTGNDICYLATAKITDDDMADRIKKHIAQRPTSWKTIEQYSNFNGLKKDKAFIESSIFLLDCVTIMITNIMFDQKIDYDTCSSEELDQVESVVFSEVTDLINVMRQYNKTLFLVSNEVGSGIVPSYRLGSIFRDIAGRVNQFIAREADEVYNVICGLPQRLK